MTGCSLEEAVSPGVLCKLLERITFRNTNTTYFAAGREP